MVETKIKAHLQLHFVHLQDLNKLVKSGTLLVLDSFLLHLFPAAHLYINCVVGVVQQCDFTLHYLRFLDSFQGRPGETTAAMG